MSLICPALITPTEARSTIPPKVPSTTPPEVSSARAEARAAGRYGSRRHPQVDEAKPHHTEDRRRDPYRPAARASALAAPTILKPRSARKCMISRPGKRKPAHHDLDRQAR